MIILNQTPPGEQGNLTAMYQRMPYEGMVQSSLMRGERYDMADDFNEDWMCPAVTWSAGGEELYRFKTGKTIAIKPAGALSIAPGARYAYAAGAAPFYSNMIAFPRWVANAAPSSLETRLFKPSPGARRLMNDIAARCRANLAEADWYKEKIAILYAMLIAAQDKTAAAQTHIDATKPSTRKELGRRVRRAQQFILEAYANPDLNLNEIASEACLSPYHLIRVFSAHTNQTPIQYLTAVRMEAAVNLLQQTKETVTAVARHVGYRDRAAFFRAFRKYYGTAPSAARGV